MSIAYLMQSARRLVFVGLHSICHTRGQHTWQQRNVAPELINLWLTAIFKVFDRVIPNRLPMWLEFTEFTNASSKVAGMSIK